MEYNLAQVNIARMNADLDDPVMSGFVQRLEEINALADGSKGMGNAVQLNGCSSDVLRRQANGNWRIALDNSWGTEIIK